MKYKVDIYIYPDGDFSIRDYEELGYEFDGEGYNIVAAEYDFTMLYRLLLDTVQHIDVDDQKLFIMDQVLTFFSEAISNVTDLFVTVQGSRVRSCEMAGNYNLTHAIFATYSENEPIPGYIRV